MAKAGTLEVKVALQLSEMQTQINQVSQKLDAATKKWSNDIEKFGATTKNVFKGSFLADAALQAINSVSAAISATITEVDDLAKSAKRAGVDFQTWQVWERVAQNAGVGIEAIQKSMEGLNKTLGTINAGGGKNAQAAIERIGLSWEDLIRMKPEDSIEAVVDALAKVKNPADQAALAAQILGKGYKDLIPVIQDASGAFAKAEEDIKKYGLAISDEAAGATNDFKDAIGTLQKAVRATLANGIAPFLAALTPFIDYITQADESTGLLDATLAALTVTFKGIVIVITAVVATFKALGSIVTGVAQSVGIAVGKIAVDVGTLKDLFTGKIGLGDALAKFKTNTAQALADTSAAMRGGWEGATTELDKARKAIENIATAAPKAREATERAFDPLPAVIKPTKEAAEKTAKALKDVVTEAERLGMQLADAERDLEAARARNAGATQDEINAIMVKGKEYANLELAILKTKQATDAYNASTAQHKTELEAWRTAELDLIEARKRSQGLGEEEIRQWRQIAEGMSQVAIETENMRKEREKLEKAEADRKKREDETKAFWTDFGNLAGNTLADIATGTRSAADAMKAFVIQLAAAVLQAQLLKALGLGSGIPSLGGVQAGARGATFGPGGLAAFAQGGIFHSPTFFRFGGGRTGVMGEAGPEAVMPLTRIGGKLGVNASGANRIEIHNYGAQVTTQDEHDRTKIIVKAVRDSMASDVMRGGNPFATALERTYGVRR